MDKETLNQAVENISLIKGVIDRTSKSFVGFSKIFFYWGLLFILSSAVTLLMILNKDKVFQIFTKYPGFYLLPFGIVILFAILIYRAVSNKMPLLGLEKQLMKVWILVLIMSIIPPKISIRAANSAADMGSIIVKSNNFSILLFSLAIALIVTSLFTNYKRLRYMGIIYIAMSVLNAFLNLSSFQDALTQYLSLIIIPFTFLYTGFFLKSQQGKVS